MFCDVQKESAFTADCRLVADTPGAMKALSRGNLKEDPGPECVREHILREL
jgi:hypothetical protein